MKYRIEVKNRTGHSPEWLWLGESSFDELTCQVGRREYDTRDEAEQLMRLRCTTIGSDLGLYRIAETSGTGGFIVKDNGTREELAGGMRRSNADDKTDYTLAFDGPLFERWAIHLTKGGRIYTKRNWMLAGSEKDPAKREATKQRYRESLTRHFIQYLRGDTDEDHAAAILFNINGLEYMKATDHTEPHEHPPAA